MTDIAPGWYTDPAEPTTQRYWDGEGWLGAPLPADATPPAGPLPVGPPPPVVVTPTPAPPTTPVMPGPAPQPGPGEPPPGWPPGYPYPIVGRPPAPRPHGLTLAHAGTRFVARMVDILTVLALVVVADWWIAREFWAQAVPYVRAAEQAQLHGTPAPDPSQVWLLVLAMCAVAAAVWFAYEVPSTANSGQTLGKRILGIKVVRLESGQDLGLSRSIRRWTRMGVPTLLWPCWGAGVLLQVVDCFFVLIDRPLHQALHDKGAATVVVEVPRPRPTDPTPLENATSGGQDAHPR